MIDRAYVVLSACNGLHRGHLADRGGLRHGPNHDDDEIEEETCRTTIVQGELGVAAGPLGLQISTKYGIYCCEYIQVMRTTWHTADCDWKYLHECALP